MRWTERQQAMLREMGLRLWQPDGPAEAAGPAPTRAPADAPAVAPAAAPATAPAVAQAAASPPATPPVTAPAARPAVVVAPTTPGRLSTLGWTELRAAVADCQACDLARSRTQTVFGVGHPNAHWMIVGEAPGEQEDLRGEPFVGAAGRLLDRMLLALGLTRGEADAARQVYIANTLKCRPPRNRNPEPQELQRCQPYLERQVELVQPRVILAMGRFAVQSLLDSSEPIGRLRGQVHQWRGRPLVVTYHPAYLLRSPGDKARAWADLCLAAQAAERAGAG